MIRSERTDTTPLYHGKTYAELEALCKEKDISVKVVAARIRKLKWPLAKALATPLQNNKQPRSKWWTK
jgi:hypothetical protein